MKKLISIFLLVCLIAPVAGTYIWLECAKKTTKKEVKDQMISGLDKNKLVVLKFIKSNVPEEWKQSKELEYQGEMYDVVQLETIGDTIIYRCWWDNKETKLNRQLVYLVDNVFEGNPLNKENQKRLVNFYKSLFHESTAHLIEYNPLNTSNSYYTSNNFICGLNCQTPPVPPPEKN